IVGDRAQAAHGFPESWQQRLARMGMDRVEHASLSINYRTPVEIMEHAAPVIREALPDANVPTSIRESGTPVRYGLVEELEATLETWLRENEDGTACVIGRPTYQSGDRVLSLTPMLAKGLEFDLVVLIDPAAFGEGVRGAVARYVSMTRATRELVILSGRGRLRRSSQQGCWPERARRSPARRTPSGPATTRASNRLRTAQGEVARDGYRPPATPHAGSGRSPPARCFPARSPGDGSGRRRASLGRRLPHRPLAG